MSFGMHLSGTIEPLTRYLSENEAEADADAAC